MEFEGDEERVDLDLEGGCLCLFESTAYRDKTYQLQQPVHESGIERGTSEMRSISYYAFAEFLYLSFIYFQPPFCIIFIIITIIQDNIKTYSIL
jgi:hypothetical protein